MVSYMHCHIISHVTSSAVLGSRETERGSKLVHAVGRLQLSVYIKYEVI